MKSLINNLRSSLKFNLKPTAALVLMAGVAGGGFACGPEFPGEFDASLGLESGEADDLAELDKATGELRVAPTPSVTMGSDGKLDYRRTAKGDAIPDFSNAGYRGGGVVLPSVPVVLTVRPGDNLQSAINTVSARAPNSQGFRGAILLKRGTYRLANPLYIRASGVVLRGEGDGPDGTVLLSTSTSNDMNRAIVHIVGSPTQAAGAERTITDRYVPVGARSFNVDSTQGLSVGDTVVVTRPGTSAWIREIGMHRMPPRNDGEPVKPWDPDRFSLEFERVITAINGTRVTLDAPMVQSLDAQYGGGRLIRHTTGGRLQEVGLENLRGDTVYRSPTDENHTWNFLSFDNVANAWVDNVTGVHFPKSVVVVTGNSKWMTIRNVQSREPISRLEGMRRYPFSIEGGHGLLFYKCKSWNSRHDFVTGATVGGPNVFLESQAYDTGEVGPHHRWATGTLFDNIVVKGSGSLSAYNRSNAGSGQGWSGANQVFWNSEAPDMRCESPPTAQNWNVGSLTARPSRQCLWESLGKRSPIDSLYKAQLAQRLGAQAVRNLDAVSSLEVSP